MKHWIYYLGLFITMCVTILGCDYTFHPDPELKCQSTFVTETPGDVLLDVDFSHPHNLQPEIVHWNVYEAPLKSEAGFKTNETATPTNTFTVQEDDKPGRFSIEIRAIDPNGRSASCLTEVNYSPNINPNMKCSKPSPKYPNERVTVKCRYSDQDKDKAAKTTWEIEKAPEAFNKLTPEEQEATMIKANQTLEFTPPASGKYKIKVTASDQRGGKDITYVYVRAKENNPPQVTCPDLLRVPLNDTTKIVAKFADKDRGDKMAAGWWNIIQTPEGSRPEFKRGQEDSKTFEIRPDFPGQYKLQFVAQDLHGGKDTCETILIGERQDAFTAMIWWEGANANGIDFSDLDLHVLYVGEEKPGATWFDNGFDCYHLNCLPDERRKNVETGDEIPRLNIFSNDDQNPRLDFDWVAGTGREVVNIKSPKNGSRWKVAVDFYNPGQVLLNDEFVKSKPNIRIYCGEGNDTPVWEAAPGPVLRGKSGKLVEPNGPLEKGEVLEGQQVLQKNPDQLDFWIVGDMEWNGDTCQFTPNKKGGQWQVCTLATIREHGHCPPGSPRAN